MKLGAETESSLFVNSHIPNMVTCAGVNTTDCPEIVRALSEDCPNIVRTMFSVNRPPGGGVYCE